jgi:hypothetical protein
MAKNIVFPCLRFTQFVDEPMLKKLALMFNDIYVSDGILSDTLKVNPEKLKPELAHLGYERAVWEFLIENKIVKTYPYQKEKFDNPEDCLEKKELIEIYAGLHQQSLGKTSEKDSDKLKRQIFHHYFMTHDISVRLDAIQLRKQNDQDFFPILRTPDTLLRPNKKSSVVQFILNDIPEPDFATPWEKIIDFRNDEDVKNKYLALINWVNRASLTQTSLNDLKEEYEYLYSEYIKHFKIHKMKYNNTLLEIIVNAGAGLLLALQSGEFVSSFKNLFSMNLSHAKLMEEEAKLPGKEIAYIYHVNEKFNKK